MSELKPCPFCGRGFMSMERMEISGHNGEVYRSYAVKCYKCGSAGPRVAVNHLSLDEAERRAWEAWNMRR